MSTILKLRRGTSAQTTAFTGAAGEVTIDTTKNTLVVHDGSTAGGTPLAKASEIVSAVSSLGFTPYNATNPSGYQTAANVTAYGYQTSAQVAALITVTTAPTAAKIANVGGWSVTPSGTKLYFNYNGANVGSLDSSGNFIALGNVSAYGTP